MNNRLHEIIEYKTNGKHKLFAEYMGWSQQYLGKLVHGTDFGLKPIVSILTKLPEINARWFLLGEGSMLTDEAEYSLRRAAYAHAIAVLDAANKIPYMTADAVREFENMVTAVHEFAFKVDDSHTTVEERPCNQ